MSAVGGSGESSRSSWQRPDAPLGTLIFREGLLSAEQLEDALSESVKRGKRLGQVLVERGLLEESQVARILAKQKSLEYVDLRESPADPAAVVLLPPDVAWLNHAIPVALVDGVPLVAVEDPGDDEALAAVAQALGTKPRYAVATRSEILRALGQHFPDSADATGAPPAPPVVPPPAPSPELAPLRVAAAPEPEPEPEPQPAPVQAEPAPVEAVPPVAAEAAPEPQAAPEPEPPVDPAPPAAPVPPVLQRGPEPDPEPAAEPEPDPEPAPVVHVIAPAAPEPPAPVEPVAAAPVAPPAVPEPPAPLRVAEPEPDPEPKAAPVVHVIAPAAPEPPAPVEPVAAAPVAPPAVPEPPAPLRVAEPEPEPAVAPPFPVSAPEPEPEPVPAAVAQAPVAPPPPVPAEEGGTAVAYRVVVRLGDGEEVEADRFASRDEAKGAAKLLSRQIAGAAPGEWPELGGRFIRPELIVSVDVVPG